MTWAAMMTRVRLAVDDKVLSAPRVTDSELVAIVADGIREIRRINPASRYGADLLLMPEGVAEPQASALGTTELPLAERWLGALFHYACSRVFGLDTSESSNREASNQNYARFQQAAL